MFKIQRLLSGSPIVGMQNISNSKTTGSCTPQTQMQHTIIHTHTQQWHSLGSHKLLYLSIKSGCHKLLLRQNTLNCFCSQFQGGCSTNVGTYYCNRHNRCFPASIRCNGIQECGFSRYEEDERDCSKLPSMVDHHNYYYHHFLWGWNS